MALVGYERSGAVATITMDDGKANALSLAMFDELGEALDRAEAEGAVVVLRGRDNVFSAGFDLDTLLAGGDAMVELSQAGFRLARRLLAHPTPVVVACRGHAYAMGTFLLASCDHRVGAAGADRRITANEVALGITMPHAAVAICRARLAPAAVHQALDLAAVFSHEQAVAAGLLDEVVAPDEVHAVAHERAEHLASTLQIDAYVATKARTRGPLLEQLDIAISVDRADLELLIA